MRNPILLATVLSTLAFGCHHDEPAKGPAEEAGEKVDHAAEKTGNAVEKGTEKAGDAAGDAGDKIREETKDEH
jgi:hypothetical protein